MKEKHLGYVLLAPCLVWLLLLGVYPLVYTAITSFKALDFFRLSETHFVGFSNYRDQFGDMLFQSAVVNSAVFVIGSTLSTLIIGLVLAMLVNRAKFCRGLITWLIIPPMMMSPAVVGRLWRALYYREGVINMLLGYVGMRPALWLADPGLAMLGVIIVDVWQWSPFAFLICLAGLQSLPREPIEAAQLDGASGAQMFRWITLPAIRPVLLLVVIFRFVDTARVFSLVFTLTAGGPGTRTEMMSLLAYKWAFRQWEMGQASAILMLLLIVLIVVTMTIVARTRLFDAGTGRFSKST